MDDGTEADRICCCCCIIIRSTMRYGLLQTAVEEEELLKRVTDARLSIKRLTPLATTTTKKKGKKKSSCSSRLVVDLFSDRGNRIRASADTMRQTIRAILSLSFSLGGSVSLSLFRVCWCVYVCIHNDTTSQPPHNNNGN